MKKTIFNILSIILFVAGAVVGLGLLGITVWGDLEAFLFDVSIQAEENIEGFKCPVMITTVERSKVSAVFTNPHTREVKRNIRMHISWGYATLLREINNELPLEPGETQELSWDIQPEDAAFGNMILVRAYALRANPLPSQGATCGILVIDLPNFTGMQIFTFASIASGVFMLVGAGVYTLNNRPLFENPKKIARGMFFIFGILAVGLLIGFLGSWLLGALLLVVAVLMIFILPISAMFR
jgi:hypothetical protein